MVPVVDDEKSDLPSDGRVSRRKRRQEESARRTTSFHRIRPKTCPLLTPSMGDSRSEEADLLSVPSFSQHIHILVNSTPYILPHTITILLLYVVVIFTLLFLLIPLSSYF